MKMAKNAIYVQSRSSPPRRRELHLGEPEAPNLLVFATPRRGFLRLGVGPRLETIN